MDYQNYEDYMRSVLGYSPNQGNVYANAPYNNMNDSYDMQYMDWNYMNQYDNNEYLNDFYPDSYRMIYPMVCKVCNGQRGTRFTNEMLEGMVDDIYKNFEPEDFVENDRLEPLKNGDVRNPNAKMEPKKETRRTNFYLRDLIKILLIRELLGNRRPPQFRPPRPPMPGQGMRTTTIFL